MKSGQMFTQHGQSAHSVAASYAQCLLEVAVRQGADAPALLAAAGLNEQDIHPPSRRLPLAQMLKLFEAAHQQTGDELIGLHMGQQVQPRTFNALGYAAMSCSFLGEAIAMIPRYESLVFDGGTTHLLADRKNITITWSSGLPEEMEIRALNEAIVAGWLSFGRWIAGAEGELCEVRFRHPPPPNLQEYKAFFACPIRFNAEDNSLCGPIEFMQLPLVQRDDELRQLMEQQAETLLQKIHQREDLAPQVITHIQACLPKQTPQIADIARLMHMSERTLRRKLQAENCSFKELLSKVREDLARHYLCKTQLSILEITLLLGFSEQSSFTAAFKQWCGESPSEYRRLHSEAG